MLLTTGFDFVADRWLLESGKEEGESLPSGCRVGAGLRQVRKYGR